MHDTAEILPLLTGRIAARQLITEPLQNRFQERSLRTGRADTAHFLVVITDQQ